MNSIRRLAGLTGPFAGGCGVRASASALLFLAGLSLAQANPTGGSVAAGSATISGSGTPSLTINQASNTAIINWNSFSIGHGELTTFLQPSAASAVLNRVTGGSISSIDGTLNANGQVYILNGNGILIGRSGVVNTAGFTASTLDITNQDFLKGKLQFSGSSVNGVQNLGTINALGGNIYLIGHTVDNEGTLNAASETVGLAGGQSVLIAQTGTEHVFVQATPNAKLDANATAVTNNGSIAATAAELRAANGNMYALAINNGGTIRATALQQQGGHVFLTSDKGTIVNTGAINASATAAKGAGGTVTLKTSGTVVHHGTIVAHGGQGGTGGTVDLSGGNVDFTGGVDLTTPGGTTGNLLLDPSMITIINNPNANGTVTTTGAITTYLPAPNFVGSELYTSTLEAQLAVANVIVNGINNVTVADAIQWTEASSLTLQTTAKNGTIKINAPITGLFSGGSSVSQAKLILDDAGNGYITTGLGGTIDVDDFTLKNGIWQQIVSASPPTAALPGRIAALPAFNVTNDFQLLNTSSFVRFGGGNGQLPTAQAPGNLPYQIVDIYGLQGIGSPSDLLLASNYALANDINYDGSSVTNTTINWNGGNGTNGGAGWVPIGEGGKIIKPFTGTFNGNDHTVAGYYLYRLNDDLTGLFGESSGTIENVNLDVVFSEGVGVTGMLVGLQTGGLIQHSNITSNALNGEPTAPTTPANGTTENQSDIPGAINVAAAAGGVVGETLSTARVVDSSSDVVFELIGDNGTAGLIGFAGLVGVNYGTITNCSTTGSGATAVSVTSVAGFTDKTVRDNTISLGGLVGTNFGTINGGASEGEVDAIGGAGLLQASILGGTGDFNMGGFVGTNYGTIDGNVTVRVNGHNVVEPYQAVTTDSVIGPVGGDVDGGTGSYYVGGFVGANYGTISHAYSAPTINGATDVFGNALSQGGVVIGNGDLNGPGSNTSGALGDYAIGGFAGANFGAIVKSGTEDSVISNGDITGIANISKRVLVNGAFQTVTAPAPVSFAAPLAMDSIFVGGFVGFNGPKSGISGSFSETSDATINFALDPTVPLTPTAATLGDTFTLSSLAGSNDPLVQSTGLITGGNGYYILGGFAGGNYGAIATSHSQGNVLAVGTTSQSNSFYTGGFAGVSSGAISNSYATGNATDRTSNGPNPDNETGVIGGMVGQMNAGTLTYSYSLGTVSGGTTRGGLVGVLAFGVVGRSFWDATNNPNLNYSAGGTGTIGETTTVLQADTANLGASIYARAKWDFGFTWKVTGVDDFPTLQGVP
jgi:filamentous hemagglutinin family protein